MTHLRSLLATARIANVPSVVSNVMFGAFTMILFNDRNLVSGLYAGLCACLLYIAGNFFNDWKDAPWDQVHRPERAIPSGLFCSNTYLIIACVLVSISLFVGFSLSTTIGLTLCIILILVILYTWIHKISAWGIWVMGSCRAMLYVLGIAAVDPGFMNIRELLLSFTIDSYQYFFVWFIAPSIGMLCYIAGISLLAKYESLAEEVTISLLIPRLLLFAPLLTHTVVCSLFLSEKEIIFTLIANALVFGIWTGLAVFRTLSIGQRVSRLLMGIPLVDGIWLHTILLVFGFDAFFIVPELILCLIPLVAFLLAGLLQKIAPAS